MSTIKKIKRRAGELHKCYKKRLKTHPGRRPKKSYFILLAAYEFNNEKSPEKKMTYEDLCEWLDLKFPQYNLDGKNPEWGHPRNVYRTKISGPFKDMQYVLNWEDIYKVQAIINTGTTSFLKEMDSRIIQQKFGLSKNKLKELTGFILSQHTGNTKSSNKFSFNR